tara:strand:- start:10145 stop:11233 length:1089 start_codon:yes stop_codon:yes gene_type:complete
MIDIIFHIEDPGILNIFQIIKESLDKQQITYKVILDGAASESLSGSPHIIDTDKESINEILNKENPKLLLIGTSENRESLGLDMISEARNLGIYTIGLVDSWYNASNRFKGKTKDSLFYLPDEIFVPDIKTFKEFEEIGVITEILTLIGNPLYKKVFDWKDSFKYEVKTKESFFQNVEEGDLTITFVSEGWDRLNIETSRKDKNYKLHGTTNSDFRSIIIMEELLDSLARTKTKAHTVLRVHPNSDIEDFIPVSKKFNQISIYEDAYDLCMYSDVVVGMTSMLLLEAALLGKPTLSILPKEEEKSWMPNIEYGPTSTATSKEEIDAYWIDGKFNEIMTHSLDWTREGSFEIAIDRIKELVSI